MTNTYYMIKNKKTGLFSSGGSYPKWGEKGKMWKQRNHATAHISQFVTAKHRFKEYENAELVEFVVNPVEVSRMSIPDIMEQRQKRLQEQAKKVEDNWAKLRYKQAKAEVERYEKEHGN